MHLSQVGFLLGKLAEALPGEEERRRSRAFGLAALNESLRKDPHSIVALYRVAEIHRGAGEETEARAVLERCIATEPNFVRAYLMLGGLEEAKSPRKAAGHYRKAIALSLAFENKPLDPGLAELFRMDRQEVQRRLDALEGRQISTNAGVQ
jgi:tetratricopeptide (TPR) repeat protein